MSALKYFGSIIIISTYFINYTGVKLFLCSID